MKLLKIIKAISSAIKITRAIIASEDLQSKGKYADALDKLLEVNCIASGKYFRYHLNMGRLHLKCKNDKLVAIKKIDEAISLLYKDDNINHDEKEYLLSWAKYMKGWCLYDLGDNSNAEKCRSECENHYFDIDKVPKGTKKSFPMDWHVDYKMP